MNALSHTVQSIDSVQGLAARYLGSADKWRDIVDFNNLDYPYIATDYTFQTQVAASGSIVLTRTYTSNSVTITKGTQFTVSVDSRIPVLSYTSLRDVTIPVGSATATVPVQCAIAGFWGNVPEETRFQIVTTDPTLQKAFSSIVNQTAFSNGNIYNVKNVGDTILIPLDYNQTNAQMPTYTSLDDFYAEVFGADMTLGDDGDLLFDAYGDIQSVVGTDNLSQAIRDRLLTPKGNLPYHPEYGSLLEQMIGTAASGYLFQLISVTIQEALLEDDRISGVVVTSITKNGTALDIRVEVTPVHQGTAVPAKFTLPNVLVAA